jgi:hypothetical protein
MSTPIERYQPVHFGRGAAVKRRQTISLRKDERVDIGQRRAIRHDGDANRVAVLLPVLSDAGAGALVRARGVHRLRL